MANYKLVELAFEQTGIQISASSKDVACIESQTKTISETETEQCIAISLHSDDQYYVDWEIITDNKYQAIYDGGEKIADIVIIDDQVIVKIYTDKQVNISGNINLKDLFVQSNGPICFTGKIEVKNFIINAKALAFSESVKIESMSIKAQQGVAILSCIDSDYVNIESAYIYQHGDVIAKQFSATCQAYQQINDTKIVVGLLNFVTEQCEFYGDVTVDGDDCFIVSNTLWLGKRGSQNTISISSSHYIRSRYCQLEGDVQLEIGLALKKDEKLCQITMQDTMVIGMQAVFDIRNTKLDCHRIVNDGEFVITNSVLKTNFLDHQGYLEFSDGELNIFKKFTQSRDYNSVFSSSAIYSAETIVHSNVSFTTCTFEGVEFNIYAGDCDIKDCKIFNIEKDFCVYEKAKILIALSSINCKGNILFDGVAVVSSSSFHSNAISLFNQNCLFTDSEMHIIEGFTTAEGLKILNSKLKAKFIELKGNLTVSESRMRADDLVFDSEGAEVSDCIVDAKQLTLHGSDKPKKVIFRRCDFIVERVFQDKCITLDSTTISSIIPKASHVLDANIEFINSEFVTSGQIRSSDDSSIALTSGSMIIADRMVQQGDIVLTDSQLVTNQLLKQGGKLLVEHSSVQAQEIITCAGSLAIDAGSLVAADDLYLRRGEIKTTGSSLLAVNHRLISEASSTFLVLQASVKTSEFVAIGATQLREGILLAEELVMFERFYSEQSRTLAEKSLMMAHTADAVIANSVIASKIVTTSGQLVVQDSSIASQKFTATESSRSELIGKSIIQSTDPAEIRGKIETTTTVTDRGIDNIPSIISTNEVLISDNAVISGDSLTLEAGTLQNFGDIYLSGRLSARGGLFSNHGSASASEVFLGFDNAVFNFGSLSGNDVIIHSNLFNIAGGIFARHRFSSSGWLNLNLAGVLQANNTVQDSLLSLNAGFVCPNFNADLEYILSMSNIMSYSRVILSTFLPGVKSAIDLAYSLPSVISSTTKIFSTDWSKIRSMRQHEIMPWICQLKSTLLSGYRTFDSIQNVQTEFNKFNFDNLSLPDASKIPYDSLCYSAASLFSGSYTDNSLLHANLGATLTFNSNFSNLRHLNTGIERSAFSHNVSTRTLFNSGYSAGMHGVYSATKIDNHGVIDASSSLYMKSDELNNNAGGVITGNGVDIDVHQVDNHGVIDASSSLHMKSEELNNNESGVITGDNVDIDVHHISQKGKLTFTGGSLKFISFIEGEHSHSSLTRIEIQGDSLISSGTMCLDRVFGKVTKISFTDTAREEIRDSSVKSESLFDASNMAVAGQVLLDTSSYNHKGRITLQAVPPPSHVKKDEEELTSLFQVSARHAELNGSCDLKDARYEIESFTDASGFISGRGQFARYNFTSSLGVTTQDSIRVDSLSSRQCDLHAEASSIYWGADFNQAHKLSLVSTAGDIRVASNINASQFCARSAANFYMNRIISAKDRIFIDANARFYNIGGMLTSDKTIVKARDIVNITPGSALGKWAWDLPIGNMGVIFGREIFLESTVGNIQNHGGVIRGTEYVQLRSASNILNLCNERTVQGQYDVIQMYDAATISGGTGVNTDGLGLYVSAKGKVISDASNFSSAGTNYIEGQLGVVFGERHNTYVSFEEHEKGWWGAYVKHTVRTHTDIYSSAVTSQYGRNIIRSGAEVLSTASHFTSLHGTDVYADGEVKLFSLKKQNKKHVSKSYIWGVIDSVKKSYKQSAVPTLFYDHGLTRIHSLNGNVDARGALFIGTGDLEIKAAKRVQLGVDILDHSELTTAKSLGISCFGVPAWQSYNSGGGVWGAMTATDPLLAKFDALFSSENTIEGLISGFNLGLEGFNTAHSLMRGVVNSDVTSELLSRYGLGGSQGFDLSVNLSLTKTKTTSRYQTQGVGGIDRGNVSIQAGEGVDLENGVRVHAAGNIDIDAPELIAHSGELHSSKTTRSDTVNVGVTTSVSVASVGVSHAVFKMESVHHVNAELSADGNIRLHYGDGAIEHVVLAGANITASTIDADITQLDIIDQLDVVKTSSVSVSASTSGHISGYKGKSKDSHVDRVSGICVQEGLSTHGHTFHVGMATMTGGEIITHGDDHSVIDTLVAHSIREERHSTGIGLALNVKDLERLSGRELSGNAGENVIATAGLSIEQERFEAVRRPVIFTSGLNFREIKELRGDIHTSSPDGLEILHDSRLHATLDVPLTNMAHLSQAVNTISQGVAIVQEAIVDMMHTKGKIEEESLSMTINLDLLDSFQDIDKESSDESTEDKKDDREIASDSDTIEILRKEEEIIQVIKDLEANPEQENSANKMHEAIIMIFSLSGKKGLEKVVNLLSDEYKAGIVKLVSNPATRAQGFIKAFAKGKSGIFTTLLNIISEGVKAPNSNNGDLVKKGIETTAKQMTLAAMVKILFKGAGAYVNGAITAVQFVDIFYDESYVKQMESYAEEAKQKAQDALEASKSKGLSFSDVVKFTVMHQTAVDLQSQAYQQRMFHEAAKMLP